MADWRYDYRSSIDRDTEEETLRRWRREGLMLEDKKDRRIAVIWLIGILITAGVLVALAWF